MTRSARAQKLSIVLLSLTALILGSLVFMTVRLGFATDHFYAHLVKDPTRSPPKGDNIVAPADETILYIERFEAGEVPVVIKKNTSIPIESFTRTGTAAPRGGVLIGIYMNTFGVHINRAPLEGEVVDRHWYNGPQLDMTRLEQRLILSALVPGPEFLAKSLGLAPQQIVQDADFITQSARETLVIEGDLRCHVVRIADYYVGKILTWVQTDDRVTKGQRLGMITWGSQTDLVIEDSKRPVRIEAEVGDYVHAGETVLATY